MKGRVGLIVRAFQGGRTTRNMYVCRRGILPLGRGEVVVQQALEVF